MLVLNNISFEFGSRYLYKETSWHIKPGEKIGLIGANGTGKSTLLRVITGEYQISEGNITKRKDLSIGFLNQDLLSYQTSDPILTVAMEAFSRANHLHTEIEKILNHLDTDHSDVTLNRLHQLQEEYEHLDGYNLQYKSEAVLEGLGFKTQDLARPLKEFSGGWRMRVMLAKILLQEPDLLLLDEPTNHLDLPSIQWLEEYLENYSGTVVIVSHDRYFLDRVINKIAEISFQKINLYSGNYSYFMEEKVEREEMQRSKFKNQEKYIKEQEKLIDRFRAKASKAKMAQSRIKALDKLERFEDVESENTQINIRFNFAQQPGKIIAELKVKEKSYPSGTLFKNTSATITRGDKIALIGANGQGKSTLLRMIAEREPFDGTFNPGYNVIPSFFAQHQLEALNINHSMLEELQHAAPDQSDTTLRTLLGAFLFTGDDVFKKIKVLSGGEKSRVALAKTILTKANFLLLDEPTNHLDIQSINMLIKVLKQFEGSFVVVSHDRFFLSMVANKIWYIEDQEIKEYPGTYDEYEIWQETLKEEGKTTKTPKAVAPPPAKAAETKPLKDNTNKNELKKLNNSLKELEAEIEKLKQEKVDIETQLALPDQHDQEAYKATVNLYNKVEKDLHVLNSKWEALFLQISEME